MGRECKWHSQWKSQVVQSSIIADADGQWIRLAKMTAIPLSRLARRIFVGQPYTTLVATNGATGADWTHAAGEGATKRYPRCWHSHNLGASARLIKFSCQEFYGGIMIDSGLVWLFPHLRQILVSSEKIYRKKVAKDSRPALLGPCQSTP